MSAATIGPALLALGDGTSRQGCVRVENGRIAALEDGPQYIDFELPVGSTVTPGLIDLHVNAIGKRAFGSEPVETLEALSITAPTRGATAFLPSLMTAPWDQMLFAAREISRCLDRPREGARPLGVHFEGPFLSPEYHRAHPREHLLKPTPARVEAILQTWSGGRCRVTMAPELEDAPAAAAEFRRYGVTLACGHTAGDYAMGLLAITQGYHILTHAFNAMPEIAHRGSSVAVAYLLDPAVFCEAIADDVHLSAEILALLYRLKGDHLILVTDAAPTSTDFHEEGGVVRTAQGIIAGSLLTPDRAVRNLMEATGISLPRAVVCVTHAPARAIGVDQEIGMLREGLRADLAVWDRFNRISHVFIGGRLVYVNA